MVLTGSFELSPVTGLVVTVAPEKRGSQELDVSAGTSGPHDFAVRVSAARPRKNVCAAPPSRPPHPAPNVRDDRETPLMWRRDGLSIKLFLPNRETKYFCWEGWTQNREASPVGQITREPQRVGGVERSDGKIWR